MKHLRVLVLSAALVVSAVSVTSAHAVFSTANHPAVPQPYPIVEFPVPSPAANPISICRGPDGNLWFVESAGNKVGHISSTGTAPIDFAIPTANSNPIDITSGPDGNLWFTESATNKIGRITPQGQFTEFPVVTAGSTPHHITTGPDGALWFTENTANQIGRITPTGVVTEYLLPSTQPLGLYGITAGRDGNLWFTETHGVIGRITTTGTVTEFPVPTSGNQPHGITGGSDGNLWFIESSAYKIGRITPTGTITEFPLTPVPDASLPAITSGADGNLWFTDTGNNAIGQITPQGVVTEFAVPTSASGLYGITSGPDQNIWFTEAQANQIGRLDLGLPTPTPTNTATATVPGVATATATVTAVPPSATATATPTPVNIWVARAPYPIPIRDEALVAQGSFLYSFGGESTDGSVRNAYRYDPTTDTWTSLALLPEPLLALSAVSDGTFIYLLNGGPPYSPRLYRYDPSRNTYTALAGPALGTYAQSAGYLNGVIYRIAGGPAAGGWTNSVEAYSTVSTTWAAAPVYPQAADFIMTTVANGQVYGAGGAGAADLDKTYRYDPSTRRWDDAAVPDLPSTRWGAAAGLLGGKWVLAGGNMGGIVTDSAIIWDLTAGHDWQPLPPMLAARHRLSGAVLGSNFYVVGGVDSAGTFTRDTQEYLAPCSVSFSDVQASDYFALAVQYLACRSIVGGYSDGTFRPYSQTTRAQLAKIIVGGEGWAINTTGGPHFTDVAAGNVFYPFIETALAHGIISGYSDGTFRPGNPVTRGQLSKIIVGAQGWAINTAGGPHFTDVAAGNIFYPFIETALSHTIISGYNDGTFRPGNPATRGQISKIVYLALQSSRTVK